MHARGPRARRGPVAASVASRSRVRGWRWARFLLRARVFRGPVVVSGCRNVSRGRAVVFHFRQPRRRGSLSSSLRLIRSLSTFAVKTLLALPQNFQAGGALQLNANSKSSPSRWGCFMKRFSADVVSCAQKLATTLCPCSLSPAVCQFVLFAARRLLQFVTYFVGRAARAPSRRFAFDLLGRAGVEADSW